MNIFSEKLRISSCVPTSNSSKTVLLCEDRRPCQGVPPYTIITELISTEMMPPMKIGKNSGRTGWPEHVWALELKQEHPTNLLRVVGNKICLLRFVPAKWKDRSPPRTDPFKMPESAEDVTVENTVQTPKISHSEGLKAVETALYYLEQQGASIMDFRRHRDEAAKR
ncbi:hypothetical protein TNCV_2342731 [Trichonephila clavipes]|nr:hypothetical protein TNCV_2342731 [Trichonephila clavipes]